MARKKFSNGSNTRERSRQNRGSRAGENTKTGKSKNPYKPEFNAKEATNSPEWYANDPALLRDAASIPFSWAVGTPINLHIPVFNGTTVQQEFAVPGICCLKTLPSLGWSDQPTDPINVAMFQFYSDVRYANSGHVNYDAPDLMLYIMAMSQVYGYINFLQRAYGTATLYAQKNRYLPDALLRAMNINPEDVKANLANFRYAINLLINKAASFYVPAVMPIFKRHASLYQNIYVEGVSIKDQLYLYSPIGFWKYTLNDTDSSGMLEFQPLPDNATVDQLITYGTDMMSRLTMSEDINIMSGDILKAFGDSGMVKLQSLPTEYPILPLFDAAVLEQMKNATAVGVYGDWNVTQDPTHGFLVFKPTSHLTISGELNYASRAGTKITTCLAEDRIMTTQNLDPSPEIVMENTRLMAIGTDYLRDESGSSVTVNLATGSEVISTVQYWYYEAVPTGWNLSSKGFFSIESVDVGNVEATAAYLKRLNVVSNFKFHPFVHVFPFKQSTSNPDAFQVAEAFMQFDVDNYAVLNAEDLRHMHATALMSELYVRSLNKL